MTDFRIAAIENAIAFADEAEKCLIDEGFKGISSVKSELTKMKDASQSSDLADRNLSIVVDVVSFSAALITIFSIIGQIRAGHFLSGATREEIVKTIIDKALNAEGLSAPAKERIVLAALKRL